MSALTSHGYPLTAIGDEPGELRDSSAIAGDAGALRERIAEDGYLLLRGYLDRAAVTAARRQILAKLASVGEVHAGRPLEEGVYSGVSRRGEGDARGLAKSLRTGEAVRALCQE